LPEPACLVPAVSEIPGRVGDSLVTIEALRGSPRQQAAAESFPSATQPPHLQVRPRHCILRTVHYLPGLTERLSADIDLIKGEP